MGVYLIQSPWEMVIFVVDRTQEGKGRNTRQWMEPSGETKHQEEVFKKDQQNNHCVESASNGKDERTGVGQVLDGDDLSH